MKLDTSSLLFLHVLNCIVLLPILSLLTQICGGKKKQKSKEKSKESSTSSTGGKAAGGGSKSAEKPIESVQLPAVPTSPAPAPDTPKEGGDSKEKEEEKKEEKKEEPPKEKEKEKSNKKSNKKSAKKSMKSKKGGGDKDDKKKEEENDGYENCADMSASELKKIADTA